MSEKLFPERQRCKACHKALGARASDPVYHGLYCSPRCARMAALPVHAVDAPRECRTERDGHWVFKRRYRSVGEIPDRLREDYSTSWYWCSSCGHLHVGHTRMGQPEAVRVVHSREDLADLLIKRRGAASAAQVAKAAGIRPIRVKELEAGTRHAENLDALFAVAEALHMELAISFRPLRPEHGGV